MPHPWEDHFQQNYQHYMDDAISFQQQLRDMIGLAQHGGATREDLKKPYVVGV